VGEVNFGAPENEIKFLKKLLKLDVFVEGGAYTGGTAKKMSRSFKKVYTIEKSDVMYGVAKENLKGTNNITLLKGDTREHLASIIKTNNNMLF
jgi:predicted RNA methylase